MLGNKKSNKKLVKTGCKQPLLEMQNMHEGGGLSLDDLNNLNQMNES